MMRASVKTGVAAVVAASAVAGCGGQSHAGSARQKPTDALTTVAPLPLGERTLQRSTPPWLEREAIGHAQQVTTRGAALEVNVQGLTDPLTGSGAAPPPGTRVVAVYVQIRNSGPRTYDSSATGDFALVVSRGSVTPLLVPHGPCKTPLNDFDREITMGEDRVGCVAFAIAAGARVRSVTFSPHAQSQRQLSWRG